MQDYRKLRIWLLAMGSLFELDTQVELSYNFGFRNVESYQKIEEKITHLKKMLFHFQQKLKT